MQAAQHSTQMRLHGDMQMHTSATIGETQALKSQSAQEGETVSKDQNAVQIEQSGQLHAQFMQHLDTELMQGSMGSQHTNEQRNLSATLASQSHIHNSGYLSTTGSQYAAIEQQRKNQLAALEESRKLQTAMLQAHHTSIGMSLASTPPLPSYTPSGLGTTSFTGSGAYIPSSGSFLSPGSSIPLDTSFDPYGGAGTNSPYSASSFSSVSSKDPPRP